MQTMTTDRAAELARRLFWATGLVLLGGAVVVVMWRGPAPPTPATVTSATTATTATAPTAPTAPQLPGDKRLAAWAQQLQMQLAKQPNDAASWRLLAQTHSARGDVAQAVAAWQRALALDAQHADSHAGLAQTLAAQQQGRLSGAPAPWIASGLRLAPDHPALLALAGELALEQGQNTQAVTHFERLLVLEQAGAAPAAQAARVQAIRARLAQIKPGSP
jgi:cytochrome c-type biogenesis protein CcmH/NrfG